MPAFIPSARIPEEAIERSVSKGRTRLRRKSVSTAASFLWDDTGKVSLPLEAGRVIALLPPHAGSWDLMHFELMLNTLTREAEGMVDGEYRARECEVLRGIVNREGRAALLYRDTLRTDWNANFRGAAGRMYKRPIIYHRTDGDTQSTEWYELLQGPNLSEETWRDSLRNVLPASGLMGVVGSFAAPESETLNQSALERIAETTDVILISAFDRDATLIWTRGDML